VETSSHDILLIGGGGAGLRAAIAIAEANPRTDIAMVSKVYPMRSHTVSAEGGAAGVAGEDDTIDQHCYDTVSGSDWLGDQDAIEIFCNEVPKELLRLEHWGCPWSRQPDGRIAVRPFGGMTKMRTWFAADKTGFHMLHTLFQTSLKYTSITRYDETFATRLLVDDGAVNGVVGIELRTGRIRAIMAKAVIICTGGCGRVFPFTTNANICTGDGMALAYRAGAPLKDMEMVQYHPTGLPFTGILITEAARAEGGWLLNRDNYRFLQDYDLGKPSPTPVLRSMELGPRDRVSQAMWHEFQKGHGFRGPYGDYLHLDLRHLGEHKIETRLPMVRELCVKYENIDPVREPIPVRPVQHYMMGGIHTDIHGATPFKGLFAAGEAACVSINGSNRLGSNSLGELLVFGTRAGKSAVEYLANGPHQTDHNSLVALAGDEERRLEQQYAKADGTERISKLREEMQRTMEGGCGIYRERATLIESANKLNELKERAANLQLDDHERSFNTQLTAALELGFMLDVAETIVHCALNREESRGAHQRSDFPKRDDNKYLAHSLVSRTGEGPPRVDYLPVVITRWPPGERIYGRDH
jgi:fumarate reductase flavoprotein subunit